MNKKQKNRKVLKQNLRNRLINRKYKSTIKTLAKNLKKFLKDLRKEENINIQIEKKNSIEKEKNKFFSIRNKAIKKKIIHKKKTARKKSRIIKVIKKNINL